MNESYFGPLEALTGRLTVTENGESRVYAIGTDLFVIGRQPSCTLVVSDPKADPVHCLLRATPIGVDVCCKSENHVLEITLVAPMSFFIGDTHIHIESGPPLPSSEEESFGGLVGISADMCDVFRGLRKISTTDASVLICGEHGTGKTHAARAIHEASARAKGPFIVIDCKLALQEPFADACTRLDLSFVESNGGTVVLEDVHRLPLPLQQHLLQILAEHHGYQGTDAKARVVACADDNIIDLINDDKFNAKLFFELAQQRIDLPPLRKRRVDVPVLIRHVLATMGKADAYSRLTPDLLARLRDYDWPLNVHELRRAIEMSIANDLGGPLDPLAHLDRKIKTAAELEEEHWRMCFKAYLRDLARQTNNDVHEMAQRTGMHPSDLRGHLERIGVDV